MQSRSQKILQGILHTQRIASGYLFTGSDNKTKLDAAIMFAKALNCTDNLPPCEKCVHCNKANKGVHPDLIIIEKDKASLKIEQIRKLKEMTKYGPTEGSWQVVIINEANTMTNDAANSFLKLLEEPAPNVVFILISDRIGSLPKTILSRCQNIIFEEPSAAAPTEEVEELFGRINQDSFDYIDMSQSLAELKDPKEILQQFFTMFTQAKKIKEARAVLETLKGVERHANQKLALDLLCLKLWTKN